MTSPITRDELSGGGTTPSRAFMVTQSVINATVADNPLTGISGARVAGWLRFLTGDGKRVPGFFEAAVCREYRALASRYGVAA